MKILKITAILLMLSSSILMAAEDTAGAALTAHDVIMEMGAEGIQPFAETDGSFRVAYLLDSEGRPYIISVWSNDEATTRMIRKMIGGEADMNMAGDPSLAITFYYNNIR